MKLAPLKDDVQFILLEDKRFLTPHPIQNFYFDPNNLSINATFTLK
jgi:hypothetical protein